MTHVAAVEEVADGEQRGQDVAQRLVLLQLLHALFQVLQRLRHLLRRPDDAGTCFWEAGGKFEGGGTGASHLPPLIISSAIPGKKTCPRLCKSRLCLCSGILLLAGMLCELARYAARR